MTTRPRAFRLDASQDPAAIREAARVVVTEEPMDAIEAADGVPVLPPERRRSRWGAVFVSAVSGLVSLAIGVAIHKLIEDLFNTAGWLGWLALALTGLAVLSLLVIAGREVVGAFRERRVEELRRRAAEALAHRDAEGAKRVARELAVAWKAPVPHAGPSVEAVEDEIMEAEDRLALAERTLIAPLDEAATRAVAAASRQVSLVTAISPRALIDIAFVLYAAARLLRRVARIYGGRPGTLGLLRLARATVNHLAVTGGAAVGDGIVQQVLGHGVAARISARLGEGVLNGLMTARFGLAAIEVCRPLPYIHETPPRLSDVAGDLLHREEAEASR